MNFKIIRTLFDKLSTPFLPFFWDGKNCCKMHLESCVHSRSYLIGQQMNLNMLSKKLSMFLQNVSFLLQIRLIVDWKSFFPILIVKILIFSRYQVENNVIKHIWIIKQTILIKIIGNISKIYIDMFLSLILSKQVYV